MVLRMDGSHKFDIYLLSELQPKLYENNSYLHESEDVNGAYEIRRKIHISFKALDQLTS